MGKQKINMTIGRFQPFTQGHLNMVNEGEAPCIIYQIKPSDIQSLKNWKVQYEKEDGKTGSHTVNASDIKNALYHIEHNGEWPDGLSNSDKEIIKSMMKRPFTNELIAKELEIVKKNNKNITEVVYVTNMFEALARFNKFILDNQDKYEPQYLMCGDDRVKNYSELIDKYDKLATERGGEEYENVLKGVLKANTGKGRTAGVSGTAVRKAILTKDKAAFEKIMPKGTAVIFGDLTKAFDEFKAKLQGIMKEYKLKNYINKNMKTINEYFESANPSGEHSMQIIEEGQGDYIIYFNSPAALLIYKMELEGQISDGYWENARPYDHWKWVSRTEPKLDDKKLGYTGPSHMKRYSTEWLRRYVKRAVKGEKFDYSWTIRAFNYAKFGSILNKTQLNKVLSDYAYRSMIEKLPQVPVTNAELDADFADKQYVKGYWDKTKTFFTDDLLKKYYDSDYDFSQFEEDLKEAETAMNTQFFEE